MKYALISIVAGMATCRLFDTAEEAIRAQRYWEAETGETYYIAKAE